MCATHADFSVKIFDFKNKERSLTVNGIDKVACSIRSKLRLLAITRGQFIRVPLEAEQSKFGAKLLEDHLGFSFNCFFLRQSILSKTLLELLYSQRSLQRDPFRSLTDAIMGNPALCLYPFGLFCSPVTEIGAVPIAA